MEIRRTTTAIRYHFAKSVAWERNVSRNITKVVIGYHTASSSLTKNEFLLSTHLIIAFIELIGISFRKGSTLTFECHEGERREQSLEGKEVLRH